MSKIKGNHPTVKFGKVGVLVVNLGTPDATDYWSIRRYLKEFLSDPRVIEVNRVLWWFILNFIILTFRPFKTAKAYKKVWLKKENESPLLNITRSQAEKLAKAFAKNKNVEVDFAMRYGNPSIESKIKKLRDQGCSKLVVIPLYPQYCAATTASVCDKVFDVLQKMRWQPTVRIADVYHDHPLFIEALADSVKAHIQTLKWKPDAIVASFHGIPKRYFSNGDPYQCFCQKTGRLLKEKLKMNNDNFYVTFQSRFGREEWIKPYTDDTLVELAESGKYKNILTITPGFAADCVETLEEIQLEAGEEFIESGGKNFSMVPCLNDSPKHIELLKKLAEDAMGNWNKS